MFLSLWQWNAAYVAGARRVLPVLSSLKMLIPHGAQPGLRTLSLPGTVSFLKLWAPWEFAKCDASGERWDGPCFLKILKRKFLLPWGKGVKRCHIKKMPLFFRRLKKRRAASVMPSVNTVSVLARPVQTAVSVLNFVLMVCSKRG